MAGRGDYADELTRDPDEPVVITVRVTRRRRMQLAAIAEATKAKKPGGWGTNALLSNAADDLVRKHRAVLPDELRD